MEKETSCGFILYRKRKEVEFLILQITKNNDWCFPAGHVEKGESFIQTAVRELREETGIKLEPKNYPSFSYSYTNPLGSVRLIVLHVAECNQEPTLSHEHKAYLWANYEKATSLLKFREICDTLNKAKSLIESN